MQAMDTERTRHTGWIEVVCGSMFSGKSEELIRRLRRAQIARQKVQIFKPQFDARYAHDEIVSHSEMRIPSRNVGSAAELLTVVDDDTQVVGIDEGQFFDMGLVEVVERLAAAEKRVIVAGLDLDYLGRPFEPIPSLMTRAEYVTKSLAVCHRCGGAGMFTQRVIQSDELVVLGAEGAYEARCRFCYTPGESQQQALAL